MYATPNAARINKISISWLPVLSAQAQTVFLLHTRLTKHSDKPIAINMDITITVAESKEEEL
jgi:hypothetical protein